MSQEQLNGTDVCALLEEMDRKCMSQRMRGDGFGNVAEGARVLACMLNRIFADVLLQPIAGKEPMWWFFQTPPVTEDGKAIWARASRSDPSFLCLARRARPCACYQWPGVSDESLRRCAGRLHYAMLGAGDGPEKLHNFFGA
jgi:hypothetical protein